MARTIFSRLKHVDANALAALAGTWCWVKNNRHWDATARVTVQLKRRAFDVSRSVEKAVVRRFDARRVQAGMLVRGRELHLSRERTAQVAVGCRRDADDVLRGAYMSEARVRETFGKFTSSPTSPPNAMICQPPAKACGMPDEKPASGQM